MQHFLSQIQFEPSFHHFQDFLLQEFIRVLKFFLPTSIVAMACFGSAQSIRDVVDTFFLNSRQSAFEDNRLTSPLNFVEFLGHIHS